MPSTTARAQRLFTALWPTLSVRDAIAQWQGAWDWPHQAARVKAERLHATLHFLGDVPGHRLPELARALAVPFEPFELELGSAAVWPNGVAVIEPFTTPPALLRLHAGLGAVLRRLELPMDTRPYRPHVTLARRAHGAKPPAQGPELRWRVDDGYVLVRSLPGGAGYEVLERFGQGCARQGVAEGAL